jgi:hypothetical protein
MLNILALVMAFIVIYKINGWAKNAGLNSDSQVMFFGFYGPIFYISMLGYFGFGIAIIVQICMWMFL